ncbi:uncharacterized protein PG998_002596 [Apiospora kogelbergensis]|uniref:uncharacterized protein n=1 Tax=Apiospora kogelbergensis TaxID=1337665 RepID=UPI00312DDEF4
MKPVKSNLTHLTLDCGISHLSPQHGWTCETVANLEVVLSASLTYKTATLGTTAEEFVRLSVVVEYDEHASVLLSFAHVGVMSMAVIAATLLYTRAAEDPPVYRNMMNILYLEAAAGLDSTSVLSVETGAMVPKGVGSLYHTHTLIQTEVVLHAVHTAWEAAPAITKCHRDHLGYFLRLASAFLLCAPCGRIHARPHKSRRRRATRVDIGHPMERRG